MKFLVADVDFGGSQCCKIMHPDNVSCMRDSALSVRPRQRPIVACPSHRLVRLQQTRTCATDASKTG